ncbi:hypothetical protein NGRA_1828 [Nosema granulosis]|uniref:Uncharacterized protein n=1 Tax=Nosema granulosis TaxID=83296 RepID=A0A9P6KZ83_9MICR|nr:hypothetical protein NGRA_1828 [Nosema granulosis]
MRLEQKLNQDKLRKEEIVTKNNIIYDEKQQMICNKQKTLLKRKGKMINKILKSGKEINTDLIKEVKINGEVSKTFFDLGSEVTLISKRKSLGKGLLEEQCEETQLKNIFGQIATAKRKADILLNIDGTIVYEECLIVEFESSEFDILLRRATINRAKSTKNKLNVLTKQYFSLFDDSMSEGHLNYYCEINTSVHRKVNIKYRNISHNMMDGATKTIEKLLKSGFIEPSTSSWCDPIRQVLKPNGEVRIRSNMQF